MIQVDALAAEALSAGALSFLVSASWLSNIRFRSTHWGTLVAHLLLELHLAVDAD
jgi:hypothetical protein